MHFSQAVNQLVAKINLEKEFTLISHVNPDGDNIGSLIALALGLQQLDKKVLAINSDLTPKKYQFLTEYFPIEVAKEPQRITGMLITLDCPDFARTGLSSDIACSTIINIDHHVSNNFFGEVNLVDFNSAATGEIVFKLLQALEIEFTRQISTALYTSIATDTGSFRFDNTTGTTLAIASFLVENGANLTDINTNVYETFSLESIRFLAAALNKLELSHQGKIAWIFVDRNMSIDFGISDEEKEGLVGYAKSIAGVELAFLLKEMENGDYKVSLRSGVVDVNKIAATFGGGGHKKAAGFTVTNYNDSNKLIAHIIEEYEKQKNIKGA